MAREKRATRVSGQHDPGVFSQLTRGADPTLEKLPAFRPKAHLVPVLNNTPLVSKSSIETPPNAYFLKYWHVGIHPYPLQPGHISLGSTQMKIFVVVEVSTRGPDPWVEINGLEGCGDPTRDRPVSHGSIGTCPVGSGQEVFNISQV